jgi:NAD(P)-dependent dehydrogenase (short-subunit alcohol dehydrogenase family)
MTSRPFHLPDMTGRTVVVTGATSGIGLSTARAFGAANARVVLAGRDTAKGAGVAAGSSVLATADIPPGASTGPEHAMHMRGGAELIGRSRRSRDPELARRLWTASEQLTGITFGLHAEMGK